MRFGYVIPWADAAEIGELAHTAEQHGWDGVFIWDPVWGVDAWASLAVAATRTSTIRLGTMLTPPSRRRPWTLAGQVATVDRLSNGRVTSSVGFGAIDSGFAAFGEELGADGARPTRPDEVAAQRALFPADRPYDVIVEGGAEHTVAEWAAAGATWWLEADWELVGRPDAVDRATAHLRAGPPG